MAVSLIPKKKRKREVALNLRLFKEAKQVSAAAGLLIAVLVLYTGLWVYGGILTGSLDSLRVDAQRVRGELDQEAEKSARLFASRLAQVTGLLDSHVQSSKIFELVQDATHPRVQFTSFSFEGKSGLVSMNGLTDGYVSFGRQIIALEEFAAIRDLRITDVSLNKKGQVVFKITFEIDKSVYQKYGS